MKKIVEEIAVAVVAILVFAFMLSLFFKAFGHISELSNDDKKKAFLHNGQEFVCRGGYERFLVSKKNGWRIEKEEFVKDDKIVSISMCSERE